MRDERLQMELSYTFLIRYNEEKALFFESFDWRITLDSQEPVLLEGGIVRSSQQATPDAASAPALSEAWRSHIS